MRRIVIAAVASIIGACGALAADLPVPAGPPAYYPAVPVIYDWGGGYVGINGGYAFGQSNWYDALNPSGTGSSGNFNINGGLVGVTAGVSGQFGAFVLSVEGDFDWQGISGISSNVFCTSILTSTAVVATAAGLSCRTASNWVGTLRARFGYAWDRVLVYGTAGGAGANVETSLNGLPVQNNAEFGWTAGGGLEWAFADNWTAKVEYLFVDLTGNAPCNHGYSCGPNSNINVKFNENIVRAGLNFKFGH